ncbi:thermonuclease family protein [Novosphingobium sp. TW-4]|uniref:Thermonuclease family protein n=1 Tax=Novosphingobium olei TaxID=2728851 RepID=A0A7Y0BRZ6_9SPHN|nr:thermonuclease family protein [Novosphingobium olei]
MDSPHPVQAPLGATAEPLRDRLTGQAIDGDTFALASGRHLRLYGADAPELKQQGWNRQGQPLPIGQDALARASRLLAQTTSIGNAQGVSFGRPVASVAAGGEDVGQSLIRSGDALAAPQFMSADPERRFDYMQAERLARQNRLGMHGVFSQTPADFRHNPMPSPDRETIARFWDTPTPWAGLRPDAETKTLDLVYSDVPLEQVADYVKQSGGILDLESAKTARAYFKKTGQRPGLAYGEAPKILTGNGDGAVGATARGFGNGVLPNLLEETGAIADALGATPGRESVWNSDRRLADIWANNEAQNEAITGFDRQEHPYATTGGEIAGGLALPLGKVNSAADLAKWGAVYGGLSGFGREGTLAQRLTSGVVGAGEGLAATVLGGKALEAAAPYIAKGWTWARGKSGPELFPPAGEATAPITGDDLKRVASEATPSDQVAPAQAMATEPGASLSQEVRQPDYLFAPRASRMDAPLSEAQLRAADIQPRDVVPIPSNEVGSVEEAAAMDKGRYAPATAPNERGELTKQTLRAWNGAEVPKAGPVDLVGWLRLNGGLRDQGGELTHMDLTNKARSGMDFVGQESRFGPLVNNESGMNFDDAALRAWEAGYFPDHAERPDVNTFLDAMRGTQEGWNRHFLPEDFAEIDRFNAARTERQDLARQRSEDGQVWRDKSVPAEEPQPFAPPEAYEEWPAGGPDFAGNINLDKLESPQDIRRALSQVDSRVGGLDAATRGRVTQAETERLAGELGMTPEALLTRRKGQALNAEEALAARQILAKSGNELVNAAKRVQSMENPGDDVLAEFQRKLSRHVAIQEQVSGMTAEAGRALQQFKMLAESRNVRGDVLKAVVDRSGGGKRLQDAAETLLDAVEGDPGKFNVVADKLSKPRWIDKAIELRYFMLLSGPQTHVANIVSNTMTALGQFPEHAAAAALGLGRRAITGKEAAADRVYGSEIGSRAFGFLEGIKEGGQQFLRTLRTGETSDFAGKMEAPTQAAIGGMGGKVVRAPMRALSAEDEVFKAMARHMEMAGLADRQASKEGLKGEAKAKRIAELLSNPPDDMLERAFDYARYITFQRPLSGIAQTISTATQRHPSLKFVVPFVRTPTNLMKFAAERSPLAPLVKEWRADVLAGGARRDLAIAKAMVGTGFGMWMADLARQGMVTGSPPDDKNKERLLRADGWQPYSVKMGGRYVAYSRLDPFSSTISIAADLATKADGMTPRQLEEYSGLLVASILKSMGDKTWLSGLSDFFQMANDPQRMGANYLRNQVASSVVPAGVAQVARTIDPVRRDTNSLGDEIRARLPMVSKGLPAERTIWGAPITTDRLGPDVLSPVTTSNRLNDPVNAALLRLGATATNFPKAHNVDGKRVHYTPQEYEQLAAKAGQDAHQRLSVLVGNAAFGGMAPEAQRKAIQKAIEAARKGARGEAVKSFPKLPATVLRQGAVPPPPPGFRMD